MAGMTAKELLERLARLTKSEQLIIAAGLLEKATEAGHVDLAGAIARRVADEIDFDKLTQGGYGH